MRKGCNRMADQLILDRNPEIADFAVIGAGNGGVAMAGFLTLRGFAVNLWNRSQPTVETLNAAGGIMLVRPGGVPNMITSDIGSAVAGCP